MYAVIGRWTIDPAHEEQQERELREQVLPAVTRSPGFVAGFWARDPETGCGHTTIVWETEADARSFKTRNEAARQRAAELGITSDFHVVAHVDAGVMRPGRAGGGSS